ncbi:MAG: SDR family oxidoreductase [Proteobacteria bacterium]|nr:SDR family oxidoreductase [Pseudomonadota bacterium]
MVDMKNELEGKVAIVTGSARNIGRATAEELALAGASLVINSVQAKDLCEEVADGIVKKGGKAIVAMADVRDADQVNAMVDAAIKAFGGVDIVVHNAAVRTNTSFDDMDHETFSHMIDLSIHGCFHLAKAATPSMKQRGGGNFVGVGGMSSLKGAKGRSHVMAAKMGLNAFIRGLALDLAEFNIRANQVVVGHYDTVREGNPSSAPLRAASNTGVPLGRKGEPQDMANLIRFVVGPGASYITGQTIHSNGGAYFNL